MQSIKESGRVTVQLYRHIPFVGRPFHQRDQAIKDRDQAIKDRDQALRERDQAEAQVRRFASFARDQPGDPSPSRQTPGTDQKAISSRERSDLMDLARSFSWVHTIDLGNGYTTPGMWGRGNPEIWKAFDTIDFRGKRVLDIGCWDGQWSFEAEARGAGAVVATDLISQRDFTEQRTFEVAASLRGSKVQYIPDLSVYNVGLLGQHFDIVLYMGIYYHLKDPVRAFTALRRVLADQGRILVEGAILERSGCFANFYYREQFCGDNSNWWVPTRACLRQWIECSFLEIESEGAPWGHGENQRHCLVAQAARRHDPLYSRIPEELEAFDAPRNTDERR